MNARALAILALLVACACGRAVPAPAGERRLVVGFSQCNGAEPWRVLFDKELRAEAAKLGVELRYSDAQNDEEQQRAHVREFTAHEVDALLVSPKDAQTQTAAIEAAFDAKIPVFVLDRGIHSEKYTSYVGGDNRAIGRLAGEHAVELLKGKGDVVELWGIRTSTPAQDRHDGFREALAKAPGIRVVAEQEAAWFQDDARRLMLDLLDAHESIDLVYAHNDPMAVGAWLAAKEKGREKSIAFLGIDGNPGPEGGCQAVLDGRLAATFLYPTPGARALDLAVALLRDGKAPPKEVLLPTVAITAKNAGAYVAR